MTKSITIISPVFNEEAVIEAFYNELKKVLNSLGKTYTSNILFVLDPCTDGTVNVADKLAKNDSSVSYITMSTRFGHQMCLLAGLDQARSDLYIMMDSDLQHPPELIRDLLSNYEEGYDVVYTLRKKTEKQNFIRKWCGDLFYKTLNALSEAHIHKNSADFRLITDRVATLFRDQIRERNMFLRGLISWVGFKQKGIEYTAAPRFAGTSKYSLIQMFKLAADAMISFSTFPLKISLIFGTLFSFIGFLYALITVFQYCFLQIFPNGWATLIILITIFSGVQLLCIGMVGTYVGAIYSEMKARPHYIIDKIVNYKGN